MKNDIFYYQNSYDIADIYDTLNIETKKLYCVMLGVSFSKKTLSRLESLLSQTESYVDKEKSWINGEVYKKHPHVTLLYGLLEGTKLTHVKKVLKGYIAPKIEIEKLDYFPDNSGKDRYMTIIAKVKVTPELLSIHQQLSLLPHINTFKVYQPHITLGYIKPNTEFVNNLSKEKVFEVDIGKVVFDNNSGNVREVKLDDYLLTAEEVSKSIVFS